ncbi:MAG TPA: hypothetical protein VFD66_13705 [Verrucomicrobiae bacterium]|nr:hypothetical protein [Verrucomicrobiae bacterium]
MLKHVATALVIALILYVIAYTGIEHRRTRLGPWQVAFTTNSSGNPVLQISQPALAISNLTIAFPAQPRPTNDTIALAFSQPRPVPYDLPFGKCIFMDTTFLPGTIVFELFGHEIQLLPRALTIDKKELPWKSGETIYLATGYSPHAIATHE